MKIALVYDEPLDAPPPGDGPDDLGAEYESPEAIDGLIAAIEGNGHEAIPLPFDAEFPRRVSRLAPGLVFNIAEGVRGPTRESIVPAWLDHLGIPYTGSDGLALALTLDKALTKDIVKGSGVATPRHTRINGMDEIDGLDLRFPLFVKPNGEGSSMGIRRASRVETREEMRRQVRWVLQRYREDCLVEEFAPGPEYCVAILGNGPDREVLPIAEVRTGSDFYPYEDKSQHEKDLLCPARIPREMADDLRRDALEICNVTRCRDLGRIDFKIDAEGRPSFLEINPLPGLARDYGIFPQQAAAAGIGYVDLVGRIVDAALERGASQACGDAQGKGRILGPRVSSRARRPTDVDERAGRETDAREEATE